MATALVTGASAGIGKTFATQLAQRGQDLVLVARTQSRLEELKAELEKRYSVSVEVLPADLSERLDIGAVADRLADASRPVDLLVNNAGFGLKLPFLRNDIRDEEEMLTVLVRAVMVLSHAAALSMRDRGHGAIVNVSSVAGYLASGTYSAAKSWVTVFSESLSSELRGSGVTVTALCPGFTRTEFHSRSGIRHNGFPDFMWLQADSLVEQCLADVDRGKVISIPSPQYKVVSAALRLLPRPIVRAGKLSRSHRPQ
ncbi:SDR family NAD(P)-dependent oxidoreductase [Flexivirga caeni]|uniref:SDR family oxidoreductase n=1 Tax=Flexivirga caeni TaxID=2294115 RepID=A0A3M9MKU7_9MICO|nr:SDR family oxidoreductase [Flexivirga caeni]RNI25298.1 SDR family oxidoreductase [Flexivirga caeni]